METKIPESVEIVMVDPTLATEWLKHNTRNRKISPKTVKEYADAMKAGNWMFNGTGVIFDWDGVLIDGQHRLQAIIESGVTVKLIKICGCNPEVFKTIDQGRKRTPSQLIEIGGGANSRNIGQMVNKYLNLIKEGKSISLKKDLTKFNLEAEKNKLYLAKLEKELKSGKEIKPEAIETAKEKVYKEKCNALNTRDYIKDLRNTAITAQISYDEWCKADEFWQNIHTLANDLVKTLKLLSVSELGAYMAYLVKVKGHDIDKVVEFFSDVLVNPKVKNQNCWNLRVRLTTIPKDRRLCPTDKKQLIVKTWNDTLKGILTKRLEWVRGKNLMKDFE